MCQDITFITPTGSDDVVLSSIADCCRFGLWPAKDDIVQEAGELHSNGEDYSWPRYISLPNACLCGVNLAGLLERYSIAYQEQRPGARIDTEDDVFGLIVRTDHVLRPDPAWEELLEALRLLAARVPAELSPPTTIRLFEYELVKLDSGFGVRTVLTEAGALWHQILQEDP